ncbi:MAG: transcription elongation factor GreA [Ardenticatenaceae bacterium]|nr:transcription elongation factor GreA [Ardenticatenaceae bacterium]
MVTQQVYITPEGVKKLKLELAQLREVKRPEIEREIRESQGGADWMDNSEFIHLREELAFVEARMYELEDMLATAVLIEPDNDDDVVDLGDTAILQTDDHTETYTIVGTAEADPSQGFISNESPLGRALLNRRVGDEITVQAPAGLLHFRIVAVR